MTITNENFRKMSPIRAEIIDSVFDDCEKCGTEKIAVVEEINGKQNIVCIGSDFARISWNVSTLALANPENVYFVRPA